MARDVFTRPGGGWVRFFPAVSIMARERLAVWALLAGTFAIRAAYPGQPIVENYVGRQVPTAMVARNLERGSGFLRPQLDTGPFPNLFLVEPPIYAGVVALASRASGFDLSSTGRLVSALATTLGGWGLYGLARRREGVAVALLALASFGAFPVMVRYGRAFQPDALMVGFVLAGLRCWDEFQATGQRRWAACGGFVLSIGLAVKVTSAWALLPFLVMMVRLPMASRLALAGALLAPASAWYVYAWGEVRPVSGGSFGLVGQRGDLDPGDLADSLASSRHDREHRPGVGRPVVHPGRVRAGGVGFVFLGPARSILASLGGPGAPCRSPVWRRSGITAIIGWWSRPSRRSAWPGGWRDFGFVSIPGATPIPGRRECPPHPLLSGGAGIPARLPGLARSGGGPARGPL